jgi:ABC-type tungstate transport system substrate-binding protein
MTPSQIKFWRIILVGCGVVGILLELAALIFSKSHDSFYAIAVPLGIVLIAFGLVMSFVVRRQRRR